MKNIIIFLVIMLSLVSCVKNTSPEIVEYPYVLEYSITGTAQEIVVEYYQNGNYVKSTNVSLPWSDEYMSGSITRYDYQPGPSNADYSKMSSIKMYVSIPAASGKTEVYAENRLNGEVIDSAYAEGVGLEIDL